MDHKIPSFFYALFIVAALVLSPCQVGAAPVSGASPLIIESGDKSHHFQVALALTPEQQQQGLMGRKDVKPNEGMLFVSENEKLMKMWMKNTPSSLDMVFIRADGRIAYIKANATPNSEEIIEAPEPVKAVLELLGGTTEKLGIQKEDRVITPALRGSEP